MIKPLVLVRHLNILPVSSHTRNMFVMNWGKTIEYTIPLYEKPEGKPEIKIDKDNIILIFNKDGYKSDISK